MLLGWLLPDAGHQVLFEGWDRQQYRPRHGKPPLVVRGAYTAAEAIGRARERYLGTVEEEAMAGAAGRRPRSADLAAVTGLRAASSSAGHRMLRPQRGVGRDR